MDNKVRHALFLLWSAGTLVATGLLIAFGLSSLHTWKITESDLMLKQSQNTSGFAKVVLLEKAVLLNGSDQNRLSLAVAADKEGEINVAREALNDIVDIGKLDNWVSRGGEADQVHVLRVYQSLRPSYPQIASKYIRYRSGQTQLKRDGLLALSNDYFETGDLKKAEETAVRASVLDPYYPQIYEQLIKIGTKLNKVAEAASYKEYLKLITW